MEIQQVGKVFSATITRIERKTAAEVFTNKKGEFTGEYTKPTDPVVVIYAKAPDRAEDTKIATFNIPVTGYIHAKSKLHKFLRVVLPDAKTISDDLHELIGAQIQVLFDESGFMRLA